MSLRDRVALVTGVSRPVGIGAAVARRLHGMGARVFATGWPPHDEDMPWGAGTLDVPFDVGRHDLGDPDTPAALVDEVFDAHGRLDVLVAVHARSSSQSLAELTVDELQRSWVSNVQSILLLAQRFAARHTPAPADAPPTGRMLWFTSGQHKGPMDSELAYAVTKGALHQMTSSLDKALSAHRIVANCINPGPVDTGWATPELHAQVAERFPDGRWGTPEDIANLVAFLVGDEGSWIRGQVLDSEGGFDRLA
ncbi:MAG: SDR family oxidoreductase [Myxococcota bacterium]|nr:SDR family oxidoreductase [Myxococcota bacterium]